MTITSRHRSLAAAGLAAGILLVAGCGGDEASAEEQWAGEVCSSLASWRTEITTITKDAANALATPSTARQELESAFDEGAAATQALVDDLKALGPPDTAAGEQAKEDLDSFVSSVESLVENVQTTLAGLSDAESVNAAITELTALGTQLQAALGQVDGLVQTLEEAGSELKAGFEDADACQDLRSGNG